MSVEAKANSNFTALGGTSPHEVDDARYRQYRSEWEGRPRRFEAGKFPVHLDIEATSRCNLRCTFCDRQPFLDKGQLGDIDFTLFTKIIDEGTELGLYSLKLNYRGEPLLHPRLPEMIRYAKQRNIVDVYCNTNAMLLTELKAKQLIDAGLDRISISVEGTDPVAYEAARIGSRFDTVKRNVEYLLNLRSRLNMPRPKIRIQTVRLPGIDLKEYAEYWRSLCDETAFVDYTDPATGRDGELVDPLWACPQLWQRMTIEWNGKIHLCHNDDKEMMVAGSLPLTTLAKCWGSEHAQNIRLLHKRGESHRVPGCAECNWRDAQVAKAQSAQPLGLHP